ncbi:MAG: metal-dependent transcriptional regulator [Candidatus Kapaibacteriales bacterium]
MIEKGLVQREKYQGVELTEKGRKEAVLLIRKHRLWETFLVEKLGIGWDRVHSIAEQLEHIDSEELIEKLDTFLDHPKVDPHGDPIPDSKGRTIQQSGAIRLSVANNGLYKITRITDDSQELLSYLTNIGISLYSIIKVEGKVTFDNTVMVILDKKKLGISQKASECILVSNIETVT